MATVHLDIITSTISEDENGFRAERHAIVEGVTGAADTRLYNAINDPGLPSIGDAYPAISTITLQEKNAEAISDDSANFSVTLVYYDDPGSTTSESTATVRAYGTTAEEEQDEDINGDRLHFYINLSTANGITSSSPFTAAVERPRLSFDFEYTANAYPYNDIKNYLGKVNNAPWNGYAAKSLLCTSISADEESSGNSYRVRYTFAHREATWQFLAAVKEPGMDLPATAHATKPDSEVDLYAAAKYFDVYESADFSQLAFDLGVEYAEISGTCVVYPRITEADIVAAGKTIIITLYGGETWVTAGATFDGIRQDIIDGLVSNKSEAAGWNARIASIVGVADVVRTSDTVVTITLNGDASYNITEPEVISVTVPATALTNSASDITPATKSFGIVGE